MRSKVLVACLLFFGAWLALASAQVFNNSETAKESTVLSAKVVTFNSEPNAPDPNEILNIVNAERAANGMLPLVANEQLEAIAKLRAKDMVNNSYYAHLSPDGKYYYQLMDEQGLNATYSCENLAFEFTQNSRKYTDSWLNSAKGHRTCMLNSATIEAGYAAIKVPAESQSGVSQPSYIVVAIHSTEIK